MPVQPKHPVVDKINSYLNHTFVVLIMALFDRSGVFRCMAEAGKPLSPTEIASKLNLKEIRILEDGLASLVCAGFVNYVEEPEPEGSRVRLDDKEFATMAPRPGKYFMDPDVAAAMVDPSTLEMNKKLLVNRRPEEKDIVDAPAFVVPWIQGIISFAGIIPQLSKAMINGGGVKFSDFPEDGVSTALLRSRRVSVKTMLCQQLIPAMPGIQELLEKGVDVADVGCGSGMTTITMALRFPNSKFQGYDLDDVSIGNAKKDAVETAESCNVKLSNLDFKVMSAYDIPEPGKLFDVIFAFDLIHDLPDVLKGLRAIKRSLKPGGIFIMMEPKVQGKFKNTLIPEMEMLYSISALHCVPQSLAFNGAGFGACWGREITEESVKLAGFTSFEVMDQVPWYQAFYKVQ